MITIRQAYEKDFSDIAVIYGYNVEHSFATFEEIEPNSEELYRRMQTHPEMPFIVACEQQQVVGYAYVRPFHSRAGYRYTVEDSVYVHHQHLGKGIGKLLLAELLDICRDHPIKQVISRIALWEASDASVKLHQSFGFSECGRLLKVGYKFERYVDTILMQKSL